MDAVTLKLAYKFARRELRSGLQGFWIFLSCLVLGVGAIAIIGTLSMSIQRGMTEQGQPLLGGDMEFSVIHRKLNPQETAYINSLGEVSQLATMRGIAIATNQTGAKERALVEVKAVDDLYPLYGELTLQKKGKFPTPSGKKQPNMGSLCRKLNSRPPENQTGRHCRNGPGKIHHS